MESEKLIEPIIDGMLVTKRGNSRDEVINYQKEISSTNIGFTFADADDLLASLKRHNEHMREAILK